MIIVSVIFSNNVGRSNDTIDSSCFNTVVENILGKTTNIYYIVFDI